MKTLFLYFFMLLLGFSCTNLTKKEVPFIMENYPYECGPRCLQMVLNFHNKIVEFSVISNQTNMSDVEGTSILDLKEAAELNGFQTLVVKLPYEDKQDDIPSLLNIPLPAIAHWQSNYFIVIEEVNKHNCKIIHPKRGKMEINRIDFIKNWKENNSDKGIVMLFEKYNTE